MHTERTPRPMPLLLGMVHMWPKRSRPVLKQAAAPLGFDRGTES
ncbi:hypothetical protein I553_5380 [Mycobacterium xenopi 4042]|uniref:Uncharacterized protein n=1 Tax=Mycobacterium xenopi 4042 TaxID=1299334 RepID=X7ZTQ5_MYCXE|nr:hypothetical protein I553_5380 [Mycobacterium xenopi 4042]